MPPDKKALEAMRYPARLSAVVRGTMKYSVIFTLIVLTLATSVRAGGWSNEELLSWCEDFEWVSSQGGSVSMPTINDEAAKQLSKVIKSQQCVSFLTAARQSIQEDLLKEKICMPEDATISQLPKIYTEYVRNRPSIWHKKAFLTVLESWKVAFPCK